ncbi:hypothetical protein HDU92_000554 [Lobulomyces angularis]|nr:hypothetical protein HDU92_000554 [Lobulomyces angularis]
MEHTIFYLIFLTLQISCGVKVHHKDDSNILAFASKFNITAVTQYLGLQPSNEIDSNSKFAVKTSLQNCIFLNFDVCAAANPTSNHFLDSFIGKLVFADGYSPCDFEVQYDYFRSRNALAVLISTGKRGVPSMHGLVFAENRAKEENPIQFLSVDDADYRALKSLIVEKNAENLTITVFPDENPWIAQLRSLKYIIFSQVIPGILYTIAMAQGVYYLLLHFKNYNDEKLNSTKMVKLKNARSKFSTAHFVLIVETITCFLLALHWFYTNFNTSRKYWQLFQQNFTGINCTIDILMVLTWKKTLRLFEKDSFSTKVSNFFKNSRNSVLVIKYTILSVPTTFEVIGDYFFYTGMTFATPALVNLIGISLMILRLIIGLYFLQQSCK